MATPAKKVTTKIAKANGDKAKTKKATKVETPSVIPSLAKEMKIKPTALRRKLRSIGLSSPYDNLAAIRGALAKAEAKAEKAAA